MTEFPQLNDPTKEVLEGLRNYSRINVSFRNMVSNTDYISHLALFNGDEGYEDLAHEVYVGDDTIFPPLVKMAKELYGEDHNPRITKISEVANCNTNPFKIDLLLGKTPKTFFVKNSDPRRYFGKMLMNVLLDGKYTNFKVTDGAVVVDKAPGTIFEDAESEGNIPKLKYEHNLIRLNIFMDLIMLNDIVGNDRNYSVDCSGNIYLLDFDQSFRDGHYHFSGLTRSEQRTVLAEEKAKIKNTIHREASRIDKILKAMETIEFDSRDDPDNVLAWKHGFDNLGQLVRQRIRLL